MQEAALEELFASQASEQKDNRIGRIVHKTLREPADERRARSSSEVFISRLLIEASLISRLLNHEVSELIGAAALSGQDERRCCRLFDEHRSIV
jgi:hypothetical protein